MPVCPSCLREIDNDSCHSCAPGASSSAPDSRPIPHPRLRKRAAILSIVTVVAGVAGGIFWHAFADARLAVQRSACHCNLKQIGLALHNYHDAYGTFPPAFIADAEGRPMHSWRVLILPFIDCNDLYSEYNFAEPWDSPANLKLLNKRPKVFDCPSREDRSGRGNGTSPLVAMSLLACTGGPSRTGITTSYAAVLGPDCIFRGAEPVSLDEITDGPWNTVMIGEVSQTQIPWTKPEDIDIHRHPRIGDPMGFSHGVDEKYPVLLLSADGVIQKISTKAPQRTVNALFTRNGQESSPLDWH